MLSSTVAQLASLALLTIHVVVDVDLSDVFRTQPDNAFAKLVPASCPSETACSEPVVASSILPFLAGALLTVALWLVCSTSYSLYTNGHRRTPGGSRSRLIGQSAESRGSRVTGV